MSRPLGKHYDGSNCYTRNCSLNHRGNTESIVNELQDRINNTFTPTNSTTSSRAPDVFSALEYGSDEYNFFRRKAAQSESTMTGEEYQTLSEYTGWAFKHYYGFLEGVNRDGTSFGSNLEEPLRSQLTKALTKGTTVIDSFIQKSGVFPEPVTVFRGEKPPQGVTVAEHLAENYQLGSTVHMKRYLSTSMDPKIASEIVNQTPESYVLVIHTKEGAMLGETVSEQGLREKEVLLPRNREYKVTKVNTSVIETGAKKKTHVTVHLEMT